MSDKLFRNTFTAFDTKRTQEQGLPPVAEKAAIPGQLGVGRDPTAKQGGYGAGGTGGGGNVTEQSRTYHPTVSLASSDGLFVVKVKPVKTLTMVDATGAAVVWTFKQS